MKTIDFEDEINLLEKLKHKDVQAFARFYNEYSKDLLILAFTILGDAPASAKKVDELFTHLWEENKFDTIQPPIHNYLYTALRKICNQKAA